MRTAEEAKGDYSFRPRDAQGRYLPTKNLSSEARGGEARIEDYLQDYTFGIFVGVIGLLIQAFEKAGIPIIPGVTIALSLIPVILLIAFAEQIAREDWGFLAGYFSLSLIFFWVNLIGFWELVFNFSFPLLVYLFLNKQGQTITNGIGDKPSLYLGACLILVTLVSLALSGGEQGNIPFSTTTITTSSSTSTSSTSTSTSTTTSTIPPLTECLTDPHSIGNGNVFNCNNPVLSSNLLSFDFNQTGGTLISNVNLACTSLVQQPPANQFYPLLSNGVPDLTQNSLGTNLASGHTLHVYGLPCFADIRNNSFIGYVWVKFTPYMGPPSNNLYSNLTFDIFYNAHISSAAYNQTKNMT